MDFIDNRGTLWDHKTVWSGPDFDVSRQLAQWQKDFNKKESPILNVERMTVADLTALIGELERQGLRGRVVSYPPWQEPTGRE